MVFFKALETVRASGKWTCADVPLPSLPRTYVVSTTEYFPCKQGQCESEFGSYVPGAEKVTRDFVLAISTRNAKATRGVVPRMYLKTQRTQMISDRYQVSTETMMLHPGQQLVRVLDVHKQSTQTFQLSANATKSHCVSRFEKTKEIKADSDMHFEYIGMEEEGGIMLRHFRMTKNQDFLFEMGGDQVKTGVTEFWDDAQTLQPRRIVGLDGTVTMFLSTKPSLSDADVEKQFGVWLDDCTMQNKETMGVPSITKLVDLNEEEIEYYKEHLFRQSADLLESAASNNDAFAIYLLRADDPFSVPDSCKRKCQAVIDAAITQRQIQSLTCEKGGSLETAMNCMRGVQDCVRSNLFVGHQYECGDSPNNVSRQLETETEEEEEEEGESIQFLSNHTLAPAAASRRMFAADTPLQFGCNSQLLLPTPYGWYIPYSWDYTADRHGNPLGPGITTTWALPFCSQLTFDQDWKPVGKLNLKVLQSKRSKMRDWLMERVRGGITSKKFDKSMGESQDVKFTFRFIWVFVYDPWMGPWDGLVRKVNGKMEVTDGLKCAIDFFARNCIPNEYLFPFGAFIQISPPFYSRTCWKFFISLSTVRVCPGEAALSMKGGASLGLYVGVELEVWGVEILNCELGRLEVVLQIGTEMRPITTSWCWMEKADEGPNRRRFWDRRRAPTKKCGSSTKMWCDTYVKVTFRVVFVIFRAEVRFEYWSKSKRFECFIKFEMYHFWNWLQQDWVVMHENMFYLHKW